MNISVIPQHSSESAEHFTPSEVVEAARETMGGIDLDPASCALANRVVRATSFYSAENPGHLKPWHGRVILNPPGGIIDKNFVRVIRANKAKKIEACIITGACGLPPGHKHEDTTSSAKRWYFKFAREWIAGVVAATADGRKHVNSGIFIGFTLEILQSTQDDDAQYEGLPIPTDFPFCVPKTRLRFFTPDPASEERIVEGMQPTHANVIVHLPDRDGSSIERFEKAFAPIGRVVVPRMWTDLNVALRNSTTSWSAVGASP